MAEGMKARDVLHMAYVLAFPAGVMLAHHRGWVSNGNTMYLLGTLSVLWMMVTLNAVDGRRRR